MSYFEDITYDKWSFKNFVTYTFGTEIPNSREQKKISEDYKSALSTLLAKPDLPEEKSEKATELYNQFKVSIRTLYFYVL